MSAIAALAKLPAVQLPAPLTTAVWAALEDVMDPEIPALSIVDLGLVHRVQAQPGSLRVELLPTFVGCPALDLIRTAVEERLTGITPRLDVEFTYAMPWTSDRITAEGRRKLLGIGFAPPEAGSDASNDPDAVFLPVLAAPCPHCGSRRTTLENLFGPTACRAIYHCADCRQPFEQFKPV